MRQRLTCMPIRKTREQRMSQVQCESPHQKSRLRLWPQVRGESQAKGSSEEEGGQEDFSPKEGAPVNASWCTQSKAENLKKRISKLDDLLQTYQE